MVAGDQDGPQLGGTPEDLEELLAARPDLGHPDRDPHDALRTKSSDARAAAFDIAGTINALGGRSR